MAWLAGLALARRGPRLGRVLPGVCAFLVGWGVLLVQGLAAQVPKEPAAEAAIAWNLERWPLSFSLQEPWLEVALAGAMLVVFLAAADCGRGGRLGLLVLPAALAVAALGLTLYGMIQALLGFDAIYGIAPYGDKRDIMPGHIFASFFEHSVAAAFLNLHWPLWLGLVFAGLAGWRGRLRWGIMGTGAAGLLVMLMAAFLNTSKSGLVLTLVFVPMGVAGFACLVRRRRGARFSGAWARPWWGVLGLSLALPALVLGVWLVLEWSGRAEVVAGRWASFFADAGGEGLAFSEVASTTLANRLEVYRAMLAMIGDSLGLGFGPGAWPWLLGAYVDNPGIYRLYLSLNGGAQDYLQFAVEWGVPGALAWTFLLVGGPVAALRGLWRRLAGGAVPGLVDFAALALALGLAQVLLHALIDFPLQVPGVRLAALAFSGWLWGYAGRGMPERDQPPSVASQGA